MMSIRNRLHSRHEHDERGFSLLEVLIGMLLLGMLTTLVLNQQMTANQVQQTNQGRDRAEAVAMDILNQAQSAGCGTVVGTESNVSSVLSGCNWASMNNGVLLGSHTQWVSPTSIRQLCSYYSNSGHPNRGSSSAANKGALEYLDSTPWFCQEQSGQWFTVQLRTDWTTQNGILPACNSTGSIQPVQVARTVEVMWVDNAAIQQQSWTVLAPVPPNAVATQLYNGGGFLVKYSGGAINGPVQMRSINGSDLVVWAPHTKAWLPFLPGGFSTKVSAPAASPPVSSQQEQATAGQVKCVDL